MKFGSMEKRIRNKNRTTLEAPDKGNAVVEKMYEGLRQCVRACDPQLGLKDALLPNSPE